MHEYPKALIRAGSEFEWEGRSLDMRVVTDSGEEAAARKDGWHAAHEDAPAPKRKK